MDTWKLDSYLKDAAKSRRKYVPNSDAEAEAKTWNKRGNLKIQKIWKTGRQLLGSNTTKTQLGEIGEKEERLQRRVPIRRKL